MVTEDYVSFETAKLLKEKGFDIPLLTFYITDKEKKEGEFQTMAFTDDKIDNNHSDICYLAPTLQMAMKWLREVHKLHIITIPYAPMDRHPYHPGEADVVYIAQLFKGIIPIDEVGRSIVKLTSEEACEAAIKYSLENLI